MGMRKTGGGSGGEGRWESGVAGGRGSGNGLSQYLTCELCTKAEVEVRVERGDRGLQFADGGRGHNGQSMSN